MKLSEYSMYKYTKYKHLITKQGAPGQRSSQVHGLKKSKIQTQILNTSSYQIISQSRLSDIPVTSLINQIYIV